MILSHTPAPPQPQPGQPHPHGTPKGSDLDTASR